MVTTTYHESCHSSSNTESLLLETDRNGSSVTGVRNSEVIKTCVMAAKQKMVTHILILASVVWRSVCCARNFIFFPWTLDRCSHHIRAHEIIEPRLDLELPVRGSVCGNSQGRFELGGTRRLQYHQRHRSPLGGPASLGRGSKVRPNWWICQLRFMGSFG